MASRLSTTADASAVCLSGLCLIHCLALPMVASVLPLIASWAAAEWIHLLFVTLAAPAAAIALRSAGPGLRLMGAAGVALLALGALGWPVDAWEKPMTLVGGLALAGAHVVNWRRRREAQRPMCGDGNAVAC